MSARGGEGLGVSSGNYEIWVYDGTDCTGDGALLAETGQCAQPNAEVGHFLSFNVFVKVSFVLPGFCVGRGADDAGGRTK